MKFSSAASAAMLAALGQPLTIDDVAAIGVFNAPGQAVVRNGETIITDAPTLLLSEADAAEVVNNSTDFVIDGVEYQSYEKTPDGAGFVELDLTRDF